MKVSVKELAEFVHRRGDLHQRQSSATLAREGIERQKAWQQNRNASYRREYAVAARFGDLEVSGRIDGWDPAERVVEEVKTTRVNGDELHSQADVHWAQLRLYGGLLAVGDDLPEAAEGRNVDSTDDGGATLRLRLIYLHPQTSAALGESDESGERILEETWRCDHLIAFFEATCGCYAAWWASTRERLDQRDRQLRAMPFPYADFRPDQRRLARHLFRGFRDGIHWLMEAPTGSGKTMASVFPALKAMGNGELDRLVFATSRGTGQVAAEDAIADAVAAIEAAGATDKNALAAITITAKERICFNPGTPCDAQLCEYARGYHERLPAARRELLSDGHVRRQQVEAVARRHGVCPFDLSLDVAAWADIVIGDYNYLFDPVVRLKRLENEAFARVGAVVDEAHQLGERVRDMLSARLSRATTRAALREANLPSAVAKLFRSVDRALAALARAESVNEKDANDGREGGRGDGRGEAREVERPAALCRALERLVAKLPETNVRLDPFEAAMEAYWQALRFHKATEWAKPEAFHYLAFGSGRSFAVELACTLPGDHIQTTLASLRASVRLSGTLSPSPVFQRIHGFAADAPFLRSEGCFAEDRLAAFAVPDLSTYYADRRRTLAALAKLIEGVRQAVPGNCLVAFPSFEYLQAVAEVLGAPDNANVRCQTPAMSLAERADFINWLCDAHHANEDDRALGNQIVPGLNSSDGHRGRVGLVAMGGLFAESVDFDSRVLRGVIVVGPGVPPPSLHRDLIAKDSSENGRDGHEIAYRQPAMTRVAQAVGRIARGDQRGVAVLVDPRFGRAAYRAFLPDWWRLRTVSSAQAATAVERFWQSPYQSSVPVSPLNGPTSSSVTQPP